MTPGGHHVPPDRRWSAPRPSRALIYLDAILYLSGGIIGPEPPLVFHRPGHAQHGAGVVFLRSRSCASNASDSGRLGFHRAEEGRSVPSAATIWPGARSGPSTSSWPWVLELRRLRDLRFPDQSSDRAYFEVGTTLTANHAHAALFGVFGMLALTVLVFCLRAMQSDATWKETQKFVRVGFWGANVGLALMIILDLFPGGVIRLWDSIANGYWHARRLTFLMGGTYHKLEWLRMVGDVVFLFAGALPITLGALRSVWKRDLSPTA